MPSSNGELLLWRYTDSDAPKDPAILAVVKILNHAMGDPAFLSTTGTGMQWFIFKYLFLSYPLHKLAQDRLQGHSTNEVTVEQRAILKQFKICLKLKTTGWWSSKWYYWISVRETHDGFGAYLYNQSSFNNKNHQYLKYSCLLYFLSILPIYSVVQPKFWQISSIL